MNKLINIFLVICLGLGGQALSSDYSINFQYGISSFSDMGTLGSFENSIFESYSKLGVPVKIVQSFPDVPELQFEFTRDLLNLSLGVFYNQSATGGRIHYSDYSGEIQFDHTLSNRRYGFIVRSPSSQKGGLSIKPSLLLGEMVSVFSVEEHLEIWSDESSQNYEFEGQSFFLEPGIVLDVVLREKIVIGSYLGLTYILKSDPFRSGDANLYYSENSVVRPDWIELKFMLRLGFQL